jgi:hypothetical protein
MKGWFPTLALSTLLASGVFANEVEIVSSSALEAPLS